MSHVARPVFLNPLRIHMPVGAWTSILHRVTGVCLSIGVPLSVYLLDLSLRSPQGFDQVGALFAGTPLQAASVLFVWVLAHHLLAGVRHLLSDVDVGSQLVWARRSAWAVNLGSLAFTVVMALLCAGARL